MNNLVISDNYLSKVEKMILGGKNDLLVLADFDRTLTKAFDSAGKKVSPGRSIRSMKFFKGNISEKLEDEYAKFKFFAADEDLERKKKVERLSDCFRKQKKIMVEAGFDKETLKELVDDNDIEFRDGFGDFLEYLSINNISLVIVSAAWGDLIKLYLEKKGYLSDKLFVVSNFFIFDKHGAAVGIQDLVVHMMNKAEVRYDSFDFYDEIKDRKNILLLGDTLDDAQMADSLDFENIIRIGFLNEDVEKNLASYKEIFDLVLSVDLDMSEINKLLFKIY
ncbi:MAG: hypothetical protein ACOZAR_02730 [Patescibacteria group bacterium]